jgi:hypothetical protein
VFEEKFQHLLVPGESLYWTGQPDTSIVFHKEDLYLIPFSLMWGGFAIFWESAVLGLWGFGKSGHSPISWFMALWGIPFVVIGQYMIWGRFFGATWMKRRIYYALTNRRAFVLQDWGSRKLVTAYLDRLEGVDREVNARGIGTIRLGRTSGDFLSTFGRKSQWDMSGLTNKDGVVVFRDIANIDSVYQKIESLRSTRDQKDVFAHQ